MPDDISSNTTRGGWNSVFSSLALVSLQRVVMMDVQFAAEGPMGRLFPHCGFMFMIGFILILLSGRGGSIFSNVLTTMDPFVSCFSRWQFDSFSPTHSPTTIHTTSMSQWRRWKTRDWTVERKSNVVEWTKGILIQSVSQLQTKEKDGYHRKWL